MSQLNVNAISAAAAAAVNTGFFITAGDGKGITIPKNHSMVKIPEKKIGKGKGKTVAYCLIPEFENDILVETENVTKMVPILNEILCELQRDIIIRMQRDRIGAVTPTDIGIDSCIAEWTNRTFSAETVGAWFDNEVAELLAYQIILARGFDADALTREQKEAIETRIAAYRASYVECASKFPSLNPAQCAELARVISLLELSGPIVARIKDKIVPKPVNSSLGFGE